MLKNHIKSLIDINSEGEELYRKMQEYSEKKKNSIARLEKDSTQLKRYEEVFKEY